MPDSLPRLVPAALLVCAAALFVRAVAADADSLGGRQLMVAAASVAGLLVLSVPWAALRVSALTAGALLQASIIPVWAATDEVSLSFPWPEALLAVVLCWILVAHVREARLEARWNGVLPLRPEGW